MFAKGFENFAKSGKISPNLVAFVTNMKPGNGF